VNPNHTNCELNRYLFIFIKNFFIFTFQREMKEIIKRKLKKANVASVKATKGVTGQRGDANRTREVHCVPDPEDQMKEGRRVKRKELQSSSTPVPSGVAPVPSPISSLTPRPRGRPRKSIPEDEILHAVQMFDTTMVQTYKSQGFSLPPRTRTVISTFRIAFELYLVQALHLAPAVPGSEPIPDAPLLQAVQAFAKSMASALPDLAQLDDVPAPRDLSRIVQLFQNRLHMALSDIYDKLFEVYLSQLADDDSLMAVPGESDDDETFVEPDDEPYEPYVISDEELEKDVRALRLESLSSSPPEARQHKSPAEMSPNQTGTTASKFVNSLALMYRWERSEILELFETRVKAHLGDLGDFKKLSSDDCIRLALTIGLSDQAYRTLHEFCDSFREQTVGSSTMADRRHELVAELTSDLEIQGKERSEFNFVRLAILPFLDRIRNHFGHQGGVLELHLNPDGSGKLVSLALRILRTHGSKWNDIRVHHQVFTIGVYKGTETKDELKRSGFAAQINELVEMDGIEIEGADGKSCPIRIHLVPDGKMAWLLLGLAKFSCFYCDCGSLADKGDPRTSFPDSLIEHFKEFPQVS
jgi:hypothetical protein